MKTPLTLESIPSCKLVVDYGPFGIRHEFDCAGTPDEVYQSSYECERADRYAVKLESTDPLGVCIQLGGNTVVVRWYTAGDPEEARAMLLEIVGGTGCEGVAP